MEEARIYGPPGTGKTSKLATDYVPAAIKRYGNDKVMVVSFTRAAAIEIAHKRSRKTGLKIEIPERHVGTLHSICFHALGAPKILETEKELIRQWNETHENFQISGKTISSMDDTAAGTEGDRWLNIYNIKRNRMVDRSYWIQPVLKSFTNKWEQFKSDNGIMDFTDLIERAMISLPEAPDKPKIIFVDEAQDMTALQLKLIRMWGQHMERVVLVGDDDQAIFSFSGADPKNMLNPPVRDKFKKILDQSFRVPQKIMERANTLIQRIDVREPKQWSPRRDRDTGEIVKGSVRQSNANWKHPEELVIEAKHKAAQGKTVMFLASCSYMLNPLKKILRSQGLAFCNPYRKTRGDWNPLQASNGVSAVELLKAFLGNGVEEPYWNVPQFVTWAKFIKTGDNGLIRKQGKEGIKALELAIEENQQGLHSVKNVLRDILTENAINKALNRDIGWFTDMIRKEKKEALEYPISVMQQNGVEAIEERSKIIIGTIHSVKGGEANVVYLFPDISFQADAQMQKSKTGKHEIYRVFYVGMTRASEELIITMPTIKYSGIEDRFSVKM